MANFDEAYKIVKAHEGGYANDPDDTGGETYKGISRKNFPKWAGWQIIDHVKLLQPKPGALDALLENQTDLQPLVLSFYKKEFWDVLNLDAVKDQRIANELFDTGVNIGTYIAGVFLQKALNVLNRNAVEYADLKIDGQIGPVTVDCMNNHKRPVDVLKILNCLQGIRYIDICEANPKQEKFMRSWLSRVAL